MIVQLPELPDAFPGVACLVGITAACVVIARLSRRSNLDAFPTVGYSRFLGSWGASFKLLAHGIDMLQEGYEKYKSAPFKVADKFGWLVIISDRKQLEELCDAPDDELSLLDAANHQLQARYVSGLDNIHNPAYHIVVIRSHLTRNLEVFFPEILDEMRTSFDEVLNSKSNVHEWKSVLAWGTVQKIICRTSNRVFVGLPLCRNREWIDLNLRYTLDVANTALSLASFPIFIRPLVAYFFTAVARDTTLGVKLLGPMIEDRLRHLESSHDERAEMPNDLLTWLTKEAEDPELTVKALTNRVLYVNYASVYTTSVSSTHAILRLAANPHYTQPLRDEVETVIRQQGWSKAALDKMYRVDSFLRECQRLQGVTALSVMRMAMKDFKFSDGTWIPKGTIVAVANRCLQLDEMFYKDANKFEPFRFAGMQTLDSDSEGDKHRFISTSVEYQPFGHGKHACPGRFFAVTLMKAMIAHIVTTYDIKLERGTAHPLSLHFGHAIIPNPRSKVLFRRRVEPVD